MYIAHTEQYVKSKKINIIILEKYNFSNFMPGDGVGNYLPSQQSLAVNPQSTCCSQQGKPNHVLETALGAHLTRLAPTVQVFWLVKMLLKATYNCEQSKVIFEVFLFYCYTWVIHFIFFVPPKQQY